jgi:DedD protein
MGLLSLFRKKKQESASEDSEFLTRTEEESNAMRGRGKRKQRKQANEPVDPALPQKKQARRRLVGAIALVLAAVIVLPMVLDSDPKPLADDIAIQIPAKDGPAARPAQATEVPSGMPAAAGLDKNEELIQRAPANATPVSQQKNVLDSVSDNGKAPKPELQQKPAPKLEERMTVQPLPARKPESPERARAILDGKTLAKADSPAGTGDAKPVPYVVQVAALASQDKVNELQKRLKDAGIKSHTQKVATANGDRIRVRVGPFPNREEADGMREKLGKMGLNGTLVPA